MVSEDQAARHDDERHAPLDKLYDGFIAIVAGAHGQIAERILLVRRLDLWSDACIAARAFPPAIHKQAAR